MGESTSSSHAVTFDLNTQPGVMQALYAVRTSDLGTQEKNDLRDQIFTYTKSGGDARLREQLETKLAELPLSQAFLDVYRANAKTPAKPGFAGGRRAPSFAVPSAPPSATAPAAPDTAPAAVPGSSSAPAEPTPEPQAPPPEPEPTPAPEPASQPASEPKPEAASTPPPEPKPTAPEKVDAASPASDAPQAAPTPDPEPTGSANAEAYSIERVREIKRYINNKIGNPVNLVDIDNELGRAYMSALLAAMQSVNAETGRAGAKEMQELERVFTQVQPLLQAEADEESTAPTAAADATPASTPEAEATAPAPESDSKPEPEPEPPRQPTRPSEPASEVPTPTPAPPTNAKPAASAASESKPINESVASSDIASKPPAPAAPDTAETKIPVTSVASVGAESPSSRQAEPPTPMPAVEADGVETDENTAAVPMPTEAAAPPKATRPPLGVGEVPSKSAPRDDAPDNLPGAAPTPAANYSVEQETPNNLANQLTELDKKAAAADAHNGDPLHAPEVDAGLEQLLQEWSLFKSSGLFGTGPNGREHPLYQKLASLMIQDVAQGRFADARPEITQSITDYMNGWRYEQGIVYEPGESFETYLRRVIRFIIDSKK